MRPNDEQMIAYLLGELPDEEAAGFEEQYLASGSVFQELLAAETELFDAYVQDLLPPERQRRFERKFLAKPENLRRLEFAKALADRTTSRHRMRILNWAALPAAAFAAALAVGVVLWRGGSDEKSRLSGSPPAARARIVSAITLFPGVTRAGGAESEAELRADADVLRVTAELDRAVRPPVHAVLRMPDGRQVWSGNTTGPRDAGEVSSAILDIPAALLAGGHYILVLSTEGPHSSAENLAEYSFRVRRR